MRFITYSLIITLNALGSLSALADTDIFVAALLPQKAQEYYQKLQQQLLQNGLAMSDTLPNKLHITIRFIGKFRDEEKQQKVELIRKALADIQFPKSITFQPKKILGGHFVLALVDSQELMDLQQKIDAKLVEAGFEKAKTFKPHVTIGLMKRHKNVGDAINKVNEYIDKETVQLNVDEFKLLGSPIESGTKQYFKPEGYEALINF